MSYIPLACSLSDNLKTEQMGVVTVGHKWNTKVPQESFFGKFWECHQPPTIKNINSWC